VSILKNWKKPNNLLPKLTKPAMVIISALLVSSLATCNASPSYAQVDLESNTELSLIKIQAIASHYQPLNNDSFILVDMVAVRVNNPFTTPHCVVRIGVLNVTWRTTAHDAVFLCALLPVRVMTGCMRVSKDTLVPSASTPTLYNLSPFGLASFGDGSYLKPLGGQYHG